MNELSFPTAVSFVVLVAYTRGELIPGLKGDERCAKRFFYTKITLSKSESGVRWLARAGRSLGKRNRRYL